MIRLVTCERCIELTNLSVSLTYNFRISYIELYVAQKTKKQFLYIKFEIKTLLILSYL